VEALRWTLPLPIREALPFLRDVEWEGDAARVTRVLDAAAEWTTHVGLSLDVGEGVEPRLGLEMLNWTKPPSPPSAWRACLRTLVERGLCLPEKARDLLHYPGIAHERGDRWPDTITTSPDYRERVVRTLTRSLLHVKVTVPPDGPLTAKAYLAARHGWIERPSLRVRETAPETSRFNGATV
jgi:hypothetical protein